METGLCQKIEALFSDTRASQRTLIHTDEKAAPHVIELSREVRAHTL